MKIHSTRYFVIIKVDNGSSLKKKKQLRFYLFQKNVEKIPGI